MNFTLEPLLVATGEVRNELTVIYCVYLQLSILMKLHLEKSCLIQLIQLLSSLHVYLLYYLECTFLFGKGKLEYRATNLFTQAKKKKVKYEY